MGDNLFIALIIILLALGLLIRSKISIKVFNYTYLGLLGLVFIWSFFVTQNMNGGVAWPWYFMMLIYGIPVFISVIIVNFVEYLKKFKQQ
jgi:hypothetical protein